MAIWQFNVDLIPRLWIEKHTYSILELYDEEGYDLGIAWKDNQPEKKYKDILTNILPEGKSWHDNLLCWGDDKKSDITVWSDNGIIDGIQIRISLNDNLNDMLVKIVEAAIKLNCVFFYPEYKTISEANESELKKALMNSRASRYIKSPRKFLESI